jgi:hypothetical protein
VLLRGEAVEEKKGLTGERVLWVRLATLGGPGAVWCKAKQPELGRPMRTWCAKSWGGIDWDTQEATLPSGVTCQACIEAQAVAMHWSGKRVETRSKKRFRIDRVSLEGLPEVGGLKVSLTLADGEPYYQHEIERLTASQLVEVGAVGRVARAETRPAARVGRHGHEDRQRRGLRRAAPGPAGPRGAIGQSRTDNETI